MEATTNSSASDRSRNDCEDEKGESRPMTSADSKGNSTSKESVYEDGRQESDIERRMVRLYTLVNRQEIDRRST